MRIALLPPPATPAAALADALRRFGHAVDVFEGVPDLLAVPGPRGFEVLAASAGALARHQPRRDVASLRSSGVRVLALAGAGEAEAVAAVEADDYLVEPYRPEELAVRLDVLARRARLCAPAPQVAAPPYEFHADTREARLHGHPVTLTAREFELALYLFRRVGQPLPRAEIEEQVWGRMPNAESRTLDAHVSSLRRKLVLEPENGYRLAAHYGHGYCLTPVSRAA